MSELRSIPFGLASDVSLLTLDVDGVLTDGSVTYSSSGEELKSFSTRDGFGIRLWIECGGTVAVITGRGGEAVKRRCAELGIEHVIERSKNKSEAIDTVCSATGIAPAAAAHVGDDWPDLAAMHRVAYPIAVADAQSEVRDAAAWTTHKPGGHGAVREAIEHILDARGLLAEARTKYGAF